MRIAVSTAATLLGALVAQTERTAMTASIAATLAGASVAETVKVTVSDRVILTAVIFLHEATLVIEQTRVALSMQVAGVTMVVAKTVANVMTHGVMTFGITQKRSRAMVSCTPLRKVAVTPGGLTRATIGGMDAIKMTRLTQGLMQCCMQLRNHRE